jgi:hypothetical protein
MIQFFITRSRRNKYLPLGVVSFCRFRQGRDLGICVHYILKYHLLSILRGTDSPTHNAAVSWLCRSRVWCFSGLTRHCPDLTNSTESYYSVIFPDACSLYFGICSYRMFNGVANSEWLISNHTPGSSWPRLQTCLSPPSRVPRTTSRSLHRLVHCDLDS